DESAGGCTTTTLSDGAACDDADPCTRGDACAAGACVGEATDCGFLAGGGGCRAGACDPTSGACVASHALDGTACDDGRTCTDADTCRGGTCGGAPRACGAVGAECLFARCIEAEGGCVIDAEPDGSACDDGRACTFGDR